MKHIEKTVFLSYRRTNVSWALLIFQNLTANGYDVFFDYTGIGSGDFECVILGNITARAHFLVLLTPTTLERCDDPADLLRREIETALANQRNIVPLMLEGFDFGNPKIASQFTGTLAALKRYNGLPVPPDYFEAAMVRLRSIFLNVPLAAVVHPASLPAQRAATEQKAAADAALLAVQEKELRGNAVISDEVTQLTAELNPTKTLVGNIPEVMVVRANEKRPLMRILLSIRNTGLPTSVGDWYCNFKNSDGYTVVISLSSLDTSSVAVDSERPHIKNWVLDESVIPERGRRSGFLAFYVLNEEDVNAITFKSGLTVSFTDADGLAYSIQAGPAVERYYEVK
jgi:hypothetical protein